MSDFSKGVLPKASTSFLNTVLRAKKFNDASFDSILCLSSMVVIIMCWKMTCKHLMCIYIFIWFNPISGLKHNLEQNRSERQSVAALEHFPIRFFSCGYKIMRIILKLSTQSVAIFLKKNKKIHKVDVEVQNTPMGSHVGEYFIMRGKSRFSTWNILILKRHNWELNISLIWGSFKSDHIRPKRFCAELCTVVFNIWAHWFLC